MAAALQLRRSKTGHSFRLFGKPAKRLQVQIFFLELFPSAVAAGMGDIMASKSGFAPYGAG
jgi:hypothetical protein